MERAVELGSLLFWFVVGMMFGKSLIWWWRNRGAEDRHEGRPAGALEMDDTHVSVVGEVVKVLEEGKTYLVIVNPMFVPARDIEELRRAFLESGVKGSIVRMSTTFRMYEVKVR